MGSRACTDTCGCEGDWSPEKGSQTKADRELAALQLVLKGSSRETLPPRSTHSVDEGVRKAFAKEYYRVEEIFSACVITLCGFSHLDGNSWWGVSNVGAPLLNMVCLPNNFHYAASPIKSKASLGKEKQTNKYACMWFLLSSSQPKCIFQYLPPVPHHSRSLGSESHFAWYSPFGFLFCTHSPFSLFFSVTPWFI